MIRCEHAVPGRLRLKAWPASPALLQGLRQSLLAIPGVRSAEARLTTGSLVVHHDASVSQQQILAQAGVNAAAGPQALAQTGIQEAPRPLARLGATRNRLEDALAEMVVQSVIEHLLGKPAAILLSALL